eukprot:8189688-Ditylum_brightwellii.AAC.1
MASVAVLAAVAMASLTLVKCLLLQLLIGVFVAIMPLGPLKYAVLVVAVVAVLAAMAMAFAYFDY